MIEQRFPQIPGTNKFLRLSRGTLRVCWGAHLPLRWQLTVFEAAVEMGLADGNRVY